MLLKPNYTEFQNEIEIRGIEYLVHFTPTINLLGIFEQEKLMSRALIEKLGVDQMDIFDYVQFTDNYRFDDKSYINLSVMLPNTFLFNKFREKTKKESHIFWCVLKIDKKYIYHKETRFSVTNAANSHNKNHVGITADIDKFKLMFSEPIEIVTSYNQRKIYRKNLPPKYPTDEQAEVLVKNEIPITDIIQICFQNEKDLARTKSALSDYKTSNFVVENKIFVNSRL